MITVPSYQGKKVGVFGLARSGLAAVHSLVASGAEVFAWDDNEAARGLVESCAADLYSLDFAELDALMLAPGVPLTHPEPHPLVLKATASNTPLISDFDVFEAARSSLPKHKVIGVTGTNGKSTTTALIGHILASCDVPVAVGGNIGTGVMALNALPEGGVYVFELSSFQLDLTKHLECNVGVLLNMSPDHLDRHGNMDGYIAAKKRLFDMQAEGATSIIGVDDEVCAMLAQTLPATIKISGAMELSDGVSAVGGTLKGAKCGDIGSLAGISSLQGTHNWQNAAAAFAATRAVGVDAKEILGAMETFPGLEHRQEIVSHDKGILIVNDSKATNVDSAVRALETFKNIRWIAGGRAKDKDFSALANSVQSVRHAYLMGEHANQIADCLPQSLPLSQLDTLEEAVHVALGEAEAGDTVLLSPACTAFDQFANFEKRGEAFKAEVAAVVGARS